MKKLHTIIGAGGAIGQNLSELLIQSGESVRLISRKGSPTLGCDVKQADSLNKAQLREALQGSDVAYLLIGIEYKIAIWKRDWPVIMRNVLDICIEEKIPLIFFDNVYMYGLVEGEMTEETPFAPCSEKGKVRAEIARMFLKEIEQGHLKGIIARSADFYGPHSENVSFFYQMVVKNMQQGKPAQWMMRSDLPHSMTFVPDAAKALLLLSNDDSAWNQTWHLPTASPALSGHELSKLTAEHLNRPLKVTTLSRFMLRIASLFVPVVKESMEMLYQVDHTYQFSSTKFEKQFNFKPTSYAEGIKQSVSIKS